MEKEFDRFEEEGIDDGEKGADILLFPSSRMKFDARISEECQTVIYTSTLVLLPWKISS